MKKIILSVIFFFLMHAAVGNENWETKFECDCDQLVDNVWNFCDATAEGSCGWVMRSLDEELYEHLDFVDTGGSGFTSYKNHRVTEARVEDLGENGCVSMTVVGAPFSRVDFSFRKRENGHGELIERKESSGGDANIPVLERHQLGTYKAQACHAYVRVPLIEEYLEYSRRDKSILDTIVSWYRKIFL